ncbi:hypothetical protein CH35J_001733 [Colletotrichum higginsianum]|uniref:Uncharacterized protein n=1 Tax=Colletotrichum higginsianum TaxID=80884 RepID=A0A4T0WDI7_9PEZI|nr:hypothetical protein CH35J_001733 [Colletotrichum higginsianum]
MEEIKDEGRVNGETSSFLLTNEWWSFNRDGTALRQDKQTRIQLVNKGATVAGCLSVNAEEGSLVLKGCSFQDETQRFWVEQLVEDDGTSVSEITAAAGLGKLTWSGDKGPSVLIQPSAGRVVPDSDKPTHYTSLLGCTNSDGSENFNSLDCILAISYNRAPAKCATDPQATDCILNYLGAFCGDLVDGRLRANNPIPRDQIANQLEACARKIALGPCVANPTGAACTSGLFAGTKFPGFSDEPGDATTVSVRRDALSAKYNIFPEERVKDAVFEEFVIGIAKQLLNSISDTVSGLFNRHAESSAIYCNGIAGTLGSTKLASKCSRIWTVSTAPATRLEYEIGVQKAGAITGLVVSSLLVIDDVKDAIEAMNPQTWIKLKGRFSAPKATEVTTAGSTIKGYKITGTGEGAGTSTVEILKQGPKGNVVLFASEVESQMALEEAIENGFGDCVELNPPKRNTRRQRDHAGPRGLKRPLGLKIACPPLTSGDVSTAFQDPWAQAKNTVADISTDAVRATNLVDDDVADLDALHKAYFAFSKAGTETAPTWGAELQPWAERLRGGMISSAEKAAIAKDFAGSYGLVPDEEEALQLWSRDYAIQQRPLKSGAAKIPDYASYCVRKTRLSQETIDMLLNSRGGKRGEPGVYDVGDLVINTQSIDFANMASGHPRFVMATTPGLTNYHGDSSVIMSSPYSFVIRSRKGKYITPVTVGKEQMVEGQPEIIFLDGEQGRFKLLGWASGQNGKPAVFYFDNVN